MTKRYGVLAAGAAGAIALAVAAVSLAGPTRDTGGAVKRAQLTEAKLATIPVEGMICLSCAATIKQKVASLDGVLSAEVQFAEQRVQIRYAASEPTVPAKAAAAINSLGYKAGTPLTA